MGASESSLADQLYDAVNAELDSGNKHLTGKITGMLLEADQQIIQDMLDSHDMLRSAIEKTLTTLKTIGHTKGACMIDDVDGHSLDITNRENLGDVLYENIVKEYPDQAAQLTGMLLEMEESRLEEILQSRSLFQMALEKALSVIDNTQQAGDTCVGNKTTSTECNLEQFGDILYEKVEKLYPNEASQITGMLLELDKDTLKDMLHDDIAFHEAVRKSMAAISEAK